MKISIIYHSGFGHTRVVAERIAEGAAEVVPGISLLTTREAMEQLPTLQQYDTLVFGSPTYFGTVSAEFKLFMEATASVWARQQWKDKLAAGFTNSSSTNGDKLATLMNLSLFAAQHGMHWLPLGLLPQYDGNGKQLPEHNGMASYLGLMTLSSNAHDHFHEPADLLSARLFGRRIAEHTRQRKLNPVLSITNP
jgi:NAD(P)H dehydrogenase (quinone)